MEKADINQEQAPENPLNIASSKSFTNTNKKTIFIILGIVLFLLVVGAYFLKTKSQISKQSNQINHTAETATTWKTYTNDYYHFKLDIPSDWTTEEFINEYGERNFQLSSRDKQIIIDNELKRGQAYNIKKDIPMPDVVLGNYSGKRYRYVRENNTIEDYVSTPSLDQQKDIDFYLDLRGDFNSNNETVLEILKTFSYTQTELLIDDLISYTLPKGWQKEDLEYAKPIDTLRFKAVNNTYHEGISYLKKGAVIQIIKYDSNPYRTIRDDINAIMQNFEQKAYAYPRVTIADNEGLNAVICYEGCSDSYFFEKNDQRWRIYFRCAPNCTKKTEFDDHPLARDRDALLQSITFK